MSNRFSIDRFAVIATLVFAASSATLAEERSVKPGINKNYENPDVDRWVKAFERESREIYQQRNKIVAACDIKPGMAVADVGAGTGLMTRLFSKAVGDEGKVYSVDIVKEFIAHIEKTCKEQGIKNVEGIVCGERDAKLPANSVDLVFLCDTYHHFEYPKTSLASIYKAVRPGGRLVLIDFHRIEGVSRDWILGHVRAGQEVFEAEITAAGFKKIDEKDFLKENYFVVFERVEK
jgi:predicted methyltransferase